MLPAILTLIPCLPIVLYAAVTLLRDMHAERREQGDWAALLVEMQS